MNFKNLSLTFGLIFSSIFAFSNPSPLTGVVMDQSQQGLSYASLYIVEADMDFYTDESGVFHVSDLESGAYTLIVSIPGYQNTTQRILIEDEQDSVYVVIDKNKHKVKEVEVFGVKYEQPKKLETLTRMPLLPSDQIQSISVISDRVIEAQGNLTISDVARNVPGVYTFATYGNQRESMSMRGFRGVPILKNGVRINSDFRGVGVLTDMSGVENLQVLKGAAAITQGVATDIGSPGGVINIITKTPDFITKGQASFRVGSWNQFRPAFDVQTTLDKHQTIAFRVNGAYEHGNSYRPGVGFEKVYINPSLAWRPDEKTTVILEMDYLNDMRTPDPGTINLAENDSNAIYQIPYHLFPGFSSNKAITKNTTYALRAQRDLTKNLYLRAAYFGSILDQNAITTSFLRGSNKVNDLPLLPYEQRYRTIGSSGRYDKNSIFQIDLVGKDIATGFLKHTFMLGADFNNNSLETTSAKMGALNFVDIIDFTGSFGHTLPQVGRVFVPQRNGESGVIRAHFEDAPITMKEAAPVTSDQYSVGLLAQDVISVTDWAKAFVGVRFSTQTSKASASDNFYSTGSAWDPQFGLMISPIKQLNLFASYTSSTSLRGATNLDTNGVELGNQKINQIEAGIKSDWLDGRLRFNLTFYKINNRNMSLVLYDANWNPTGFYMKGGNDQRMGLEAEVLGRLHKNLEIILGYAYIDAQYKEHNAYFLGSAPLNTPKHTANAWINYTFSEGVLKNLNFGAGAFYIGERPVNDYAMTVTHAGMVAGQKPFYIKPVTTVNFQASYQYKDYGIRLLFNNIFNQIGYNAYRTSFINQTDPRNFAAVLSYKF